VTSLKKILNSLLSKSLVGLPPPPHHRNLRTRFRMHFCMQDDQIGQKIVGLAPADMARLPPSINPTKIFLAVNNLV
jgi:hypothetical protein